MTTLPPSRPNRRPVRAVMRRHGRLHRGNSRWRPRPRLRRHGQAQSCATGPTARVLHHPRHRTRPPHPRLRRHAQPKSLLRASEVCRMSRPPAHRRNGSGRRAPHRRRASRYLPRAWQRRGAATHRRRSHRRRWRRSVRRPTRRIRRWLCVPMRPCQSAMAARPPSRGASSHPTRPPRAAGRSARGIEARGRRTAHTERPARTVGAHEPRRARARAQPRRRPHRRHAPRRRSRRPQCRRRRS